jgi:hypothetical protein
MAMIFQVLRKKNAYFSSKQIAVKVFQSKLGHPKMALIGIGRL